METAFPGQPWRLLLGPAIPAVLLCCAEPTTPEAPHHWSVSQGYLRDDDGRVVILRGVNLAGAHKNAPYFDFHQPEDFARIASDRGMNAVRFLLSWSALEPTQSHYDDAYLAEVRKRMDWAHSAGLHVVLDMHQDLYGEGFTGGNGAPRWTCDESRYAAFVPTSPWFLNYLDENVMACFDGFWKNPSLRRAYRDALRHLAERLGDHPAIIGIDPMNEPWLGSTSVDEFEPRYLMPLYTDVVTAVREAAPHWIAFLEPSSSANLGEPTRLPPFDLPNVVYAPHVYDATAEGGGGFDPTHRNIIFDKVARLKSEASSLGAALWIGEYGGFPGHPGISDYMDADYDAFAGAFAGSAHWEDGRNDGYGYYNPDGTEKHELSVLIRPYPYKLAGQPVAWSYDDSTQTLDVSFDSTGGTSIVVTPVRVYPEGPQVDCDACSYEISGGTLRISAEAGTRTSVRVRRQEPG